MGQGASEVARQLGLARDEVRGVQSWLQQAATRRSLYAGELARLEAVLALCEDEVVRSLQEEVVDIGQYAGKKKALAETRDEVVSQRINIHALDRAIRLKEAHMKVLQGEVLRLARLLDSAGGSVLPWPRD